MNHFPVPRQRVLVAQQTDTTTIDLTTAHRVTWHDQQQPLDPPLPLPVPQQRVTFELLQDDTAIAQPITPTITMQTPDKSVPPPPLPWTAFDVASVRGTSITLPSTSAAFTNATTAHRASNLAARISEVEDELRRSRDYYSSK
jgi:hypothetical protein